MTVCYLRTRVKDITADFRKNLAPSSEHGKSKMSLEVVKNIARIPLNVLLMVVLLPVLLIEYVIGGLTMLATLLSLLQCDDIATGFKFITAYQTGALLKTKFPNSIAVRS